jgi:MerR family mercuric resistance operon transcriptional regulator
LDFDTQQRRREMSGLTIGRVARETGVGIETLRFYEREGLIAEPARRPSGYRDYGPAVIQRVGFIRRAKELGFSLREIAELLSLRVDEERTCADVYALARDKISDIERRIAELRRMKKALASLAAACTGAGPTGECPILDELERQDGRSGNPDRATTRTGRHGREA